MVLRINTNRIADSAITTAKMAANSVTSSIVADQAFTTGKIADSAVTTAKLNNGAVTNEKIASGTISSDKLQAGIILPSPTSNTTWILTNDGTSAIWRAQTSIRIDISQVSGILIDSYSRNWANASFTTANAAFTKANTAITSTGGTISTTTDSTSITTGALVISGGLGVAKNVYASNVAVTKDIIAGLADGAPLGGATNPIIAAIGNTDYYIQSYQINYANTPNASSDFVAYPNNGLDANGWIDMGITSNTFNQSIYSVTGRNEGYVFMSAPGGSGTSGNLVIATDSTGAYNTIEFVVGGFNKGKTNSNVIFTTQSTSVSPVTGTVQVKGGVGITGNTYVGALYTGSTYSAGLFAEKTNVITSATGLTTNNTYQLIDGVVHYHTSNSTANSTVNLTGFSTIAVGNSISMAILVTNNTMPKYITNVQVDGTETNTSIKWSGGSRPTSGASSNVDVYSFSVIKTAAPNTYTILASKTQFG